MLKKIILSVIALLLLLTIGIFLYIQHLKPTYQGNEKITGLDETVEIYYDSIGVPHIYAQNQKDAYTALGYVHAQDRLWQMELVRRIAAGRLSEIFGNDKEKGDNLFLDTDKFFLALGIEDAAINAIQQLDTSSQSYKLTQSYLKGVNQYIDKGPTPLEFTLAGVKKEKYELKDVYNVFGYMSFNFAMAHKTDPLLHNIKNKLDPAYLNELDIAIDSTKTMIPSSDFDEPIESAIITRVDDILNNLPVAPFIGSNSWVIGPDKTLSGRVILANDPHIGFAQPSVWYQSHIVCPDYEMYGYNLALTPFPLLGHNRSYAYGLTMLENDDIDFYQEKLNPVDNNEYLSDSVYVPFELREKIIKVRKGDDEVLTVRVGKHGPIMTDFIKSIKPDEAIAMDWVFTQLDNQMLNASYDISHASNLEAFKNGVAKIHAPGLNVMYGDAKGNIAWFGAGKLYTHDADVNSKFVLDGSNGNDDQVTYLDFSENPQSINPFEGYVYSANNQPDKTVKGYIPGYYLPEDRAKRIVEELDAMSDIVVEDMKELINDVTSSMAPDLVAKIVEDIDEMALEKHELAALRILRSWDGRFDLNQVAPTIYEKFKYQFYKNTFEDELGEDYFNQFIITHLAKRQFAKQVMNENSVWDDNIQTPDVVETKRENIVKSFKETVAFLEEKHGALVINWKWKNVHKVTFKHPMGEKVKFLNLDIGPYPVSGSNEVLNNQMFTMNGNGEYEVTAGPSTRRIIDFNDIENSLSILPTGQSGNVFSKHYRDQAQHYLQGKFFRMLLNKEEIQQTEDKLVLDPK